MEIKEIQKIINKQREYFNSGATYPINFRIDALKKLKTKILEYENEIYQALQSDLGKSDYESYMCEVGMVLSEISHMIKHTRKYAKEKKVKTPLAQFSANSYTKPSPYGNVLIMSPWNYPFLLSMDPIVDAISAGNTIVVKPSAYSPHTSEVINKILTECFPIEYVSVVLGGRQENAGLLKQKFDLIFFTGSQAVGKEVLKNASEHLTPAILELGGKSPCIIDSSADLKLAAKRIVFGKYLNCGQTCVAPDYIICDKLIKDQLITELQNEVIKQFGSSPLENQDYGKIINEKHFNRICGLIDKEKIVIGGKSNKDTLKIEPTILNNITWDDKVMQEEIFGPVLPILEYDKFDNIFSLFDKKDSPLALYLFSTNKKNIKRITTNCRFGGGCINDTIIHLATSEMGFGGVGASGMGSYHGINGFNAFSHTKSIVSKHNWIDLPMRYQPYNRKKFAKIIRSFLK